ncbi:MAG TPA: nitrous oxide reductase family maturation protein NosD [Gammaproteobacteria bacterium]|nr:nitrous oxide reductase family maturation protein NosD [Gammaproteobacteria bacterium]
MTRSSTIWTLFLAVVLTSPALSARAATRLVDGGGQALQAAVAAAAPGDTLVLAAGDYRVHLIIERPLTLQGRPGAVLDGAGQGNVITIRAPDTTVRDLAVVHSGRNLTKMNAGIFVERKAARVTIQGNRLDDVAFGIWLDGCADARIERNRIHGIPSIRSQDRGNGVHLFNVHGAVVAGNEIWQTRDGIYIDTSNGNTLRDNDIHDLRYGIHYMYSHHNRIVGNRTRHTRTGYALMQSNHLTVIGNRSEEDRNYGILMNYITYSEIRDNVIEDTARGRAFVTGGAGVIGAEGKAIFVYNSPFNTINDNIFRGSDIGIHLTAGSEDNAVYDNAFLHNRNQVKYVASREQEWSHDGRGNYWSDYLGWDLDGDGVGDVPYEPNDGVDKLLWKYPLARMLMNSPAVATLRWVQSEFPVLRPPGVKDTHPLMHPPAAADVTATPSKRP